MYRPPLRAFALSFFLGGCIPSEMPPLRPAPHVDQIAPSTAALDALRQIAKDLERRNDELQQSIEERQASVDDLQEQQRSLLAALTEQREQQRTLSADLDHLAYRRDRINDEIRAGEQRSHRLYDVNQQLTDQIEDTRRELSQVRHQVALLSRRHTDLSTSVVTLSRHSDSVATHSTKELHSPTTVESTHVSRPAPPSTTVSTPSRTSTDQHVRDFVADLVRSSSYSVRKFVDNSMADARRVRRAYSAGRHAEYDWSHPDTRRTYVIRVWQDDYSRVVLFTYR